MILTAIEITETIKHTPLTCKNQAARVIYYEEPLREEAVEVFIYENTLSPEEAIVQSLYTSYQRHTEKPNKDEVQAIVTSFVLSPIETSKFEETYQNCTQDRLPKAIESAGKILTGYQLFNETDLKVLFAKTAEGYIYFVWECGAA